MLADFKSDGGSASVVELLTFKRLRKLCSPPLLSRCLSTRSGNKILYQHHRHVQGILENEVPTRDLKKK